LVRAYIQRHDLLRAGDRVGVAVSGGADSVALLRILLELRAELGIVLSVIHLNHKLRGADSDADEAFVHKLAVKNGLEFIPRAVDVAAHAAGNKLSLEAAAREVRYELFESLLAQDSLSRVATAHTLDDQAETVLLKLLRGAGTRGLAGIYPKLSVPPVAGRTRPEGAVVRPLLQVRRKDVESYLREMKQGWREDSSNREWRHMRNRVRLKILPELEKQVNPSARKALAEAAEIARAEEQFWAQQVLRYLPQVSKSVAGGGIALGGCFAGLELALRRRLLRAAAESLGLRLEFRQVEELLALPEGGRAALPEKWMAVRRRQEIQLARISTDTVDYEYQLTVPGKTAVRECGLILEADVLTGQDRSRRYNPEHLLHARFLQRRLVVRNWRTGDRFWPAHTKQPRKIKELLQDRHITGDQKKRWPVVASGDEVVWVQSLGVGRDLQSKNGRGVLIRQLSIGDKGDSE
jgi:tRNA(Ile)-lysidine synthase